MNFELKRGKSMNEMTNNFLYIFFYLFPIIILFITMKIKPNLNFFPIPVRVVDLLTPYLLLSVTIQSKMIQLETAHLYFYIFLHLFGIILASYFAFGKAYLSLSNFFRTWWRYTFIFSLIYHLIVGAYGIYLHIL